MALRNPSRFFIKQFRGLNDLQNPVNIPPDWWIDSNNVVVNMTGSAEGLRSPKAFNSSVGSGNPVLQLVDFNNPVHHCVVFDIENAAAGGSSGSSSGSESSGDGDIATYFINDSLGNTLLRSGQSAAFRSLVVASKLYRINPDEFIQLMPDVSSPQFYRVGIDPPAAAPTLTQTGGTPESSEGSSETSSEEEAESDTGSVLVGISCSYAYMNTTTGHVSKPSPVSNVLGPTDGPVTLNIAVTESTQDGVDKIVLFLTLDGGAERYLLIDSNGDVQQFANTTGTITVDVVDVALDTLTPEPLYNDVPPTGGSFLFYWKDRVFIVGFDGSGDVPFSGLVYSGFESCYIGVPWEAWPPLNRIYIPNRGEQLVGGIGTQSGALIFSDYDAYLISGYPTDKTQGPEASETVSEHLEPMHWRLGTRNPKTIQNTPFGTVWLDQNQRLQLWSGQGFPTEFGLPLRKALDEIDPTKVTEAEGKWFQHGKNGGFYVLVAPVIDGESSSSSGDEGSLELNAVFGLTSDATYIYVTDYNPDLGKYVIHKVAKADLSVEVDSLEFVDANHSVGPILALGGFLYATSAETSISGAHTLHKINASNMTQVDTLSLGFTSALINEDAAAFVVDPTGQYLLLSSNNIIVAGVNATHPAVKVQISDLSIVETATCVGIVNFDTRQMSNAAHHFACDDTYLYIPASAHSESDPDRNYLVVYRFTISPFEFVDSQAFGTGTSTGNSVTSIDRIGDKLYIPFTGTPNGYVIVDTGSFSEDNVINPTSMTGNLFSKTADSTHLYIARTDHDLRQITPSSGATVNSHTFSATVAFLTGSYYVITFDGATWRLEGITSF